MYDDDDDKKEITKRDAEENPIWMQTMTMMESEREGMVEIDGGALSKEAFDGF